MVRDWEAVLRNWSKPSSDSELTKSQNAESMVRDAIKKHTPFATKNISIFTQGSYRNNTNVKQDSDVDICVCCNDIIVPDYSLSPTINNFFTGLIPAQYQYHQFKSDVQSALINKFDAWNVTKGEKAFDIHANAYRIDADVVPAMELRLYLPNGTYVVGTCLLSDTGNYIHNWPRQHYENGVAKNNRTSNKFKFITRSIKRLRNEMHENKIQEATPIASYLIECLVYNLPDYFFENDSYYDIVEKALVYMATMTEEDNKCSSWLEVNNIKYLFHPSQKWTRQQVNAFICKAWYYLKTN